LLGLNNNLRYQNLTAVISKRSAYPAIRVISQAKQQQGVRDGKSIRRVFQQSGEGEEALSFSEFVQAVS
jgi:hypothetical protein